MYRRPAGFVLGFHGCDQRVADRIFACRSNEMKPSTNEYDWLGNGVYFWENNPARAMEWAEEQKKRAEKKSGDAFIPAVVGAVIDLGHCLNLLDSYYLGLVKDTYETYLRIVEANHGRLPQNKGGKDKYLRPLDCAVIQLLCTAYSDKKEAFDTVRGIFPEGDELYPNAGFQAKNHIQIAVRNPNAIKGFFRPLDRISEYSVPGVV